MLDVREKLYSKQIDATGIDPLSVYRMIRKEYQESFFLETAPAIDQSREFCLIGLGPFSKLSGHNVALPFFELLTEQIRKIQGEVREASRFPYGGIFGLLGYDAATEIEPRLKQSGYFKTSGTPDKNFFHATELLVFDFLLNTLTLYSKKSDQQLDHYKNLAFSCVKNGGLNASSTAAMDATRLRPSLGRDAFTKGVKKIKEHIKNGDIFQAVLAERMEVEVAATDLEIFSFLHAQNNTPYKFFFADSERSFFGASPESLLKVRDQKIFSHPIAGTKPRGKNPSEDRLLARRLRRSKKEAAEHMMLVDLARNDLGKVAMAGTVKVKKFRSLKRFSNVMHLVSELEAILSPQKSVVDGLQACFPAGTLSGAPKLRAMEILSEIERTPRGLYGGAVVAFDGRGGLDSCISIRSAEMHGKNIILRAGAGIVADSVAELEYLEIEHKLLALRKAIAAAEFARLQ